MNTNKPGKHRTQIVDKNGKTTHVWKNAGQPENIARIAPAPKVAEERNPVNGATRSQFEALQQSILKNLDRDGALMLREQGFVDMGLNDEFRGEFWMSNRVNEFKLFGNGTQYSPYFIQPYKSDRETLMAVDRVNEDIAEIFGTKPHSKFAPLRLDATVSNGEISFTTPDGEEVVYEPDDKPDEFMPVIVERTADGNYHVAWASYSPEATSDYDFGDDVFETFRSEADRDAFIEQKKAEGVPESRIFVIDKYEHSGVHYSVNETAAYPDRRWDVVPSGVYVASDDFGARVDFINSTLDEYSSWCNGDIYSIYSTKIDSEGEELLEVEYLMDSIGSEATQKTLESGHY